MKDINKNLIELLLHCNPSFKWPITKGKFPSDIKGIPKGLWVYAWVNTLIEIDLRKWSNCYDEPAQYQAKITPKGIARLKKLLKEKGRENNFKILLAIVIGASLSLLFYIFFKI